MAPPSTPALVGLGPGPLTGHRFELANGYLVLGREHGCGLCLSDPHVSRRHAALTVSEGRAWVQDLGSAEGTFVNGRPVVGTQELRPGDVVALAVIRLRYEPGRPAAAARFDVDHQAGGTINNVGGNQYRYIQQRDSLLRDVAATRTRARWLVGFGVVVALAGFAVFAAGVLGFLTDVANAVGSGDPTAEPTTTPFGRPIFGVPSGLIGWACAAAGSVMVVLGIVFHVVATARRRRVDRDMPPLPYR